MVHALERARALLTSDGVVIDVHDTRKPPVIQVFRENQKIETDWLLDRAGFPELRQADEAADELVSAGLLTYSEEREFDYQTTADSMDGFREWLEAQWETSYLPVKTESRIE